MGNILLWIYDISLNELEEDTSSEEEEDDDFSSSECDSISLDPSLKIMGDVEAMGLGGYLELYEVEDNFWYELDDVINAKKETLQALLQIMSN
jgi:hypothetical protein